MKNSLGDIFNIGSIKMNLDGKTKDMVFTELINGIASSTAECNPAELLAAIWRREKKMSTGIGFGIAIPHAFCKGITDVVGAIGISHQGLDYDALDKKPVHVVFLLGISERMEETHLHILNVVFSLMESDMITQIQNAKNAEDIHSILSQTRLA